MSGGHFEYKQYYIRDIAETIKDEILLNDDTDEYGGDRYKYSDETIAEFKKGVALLEKAAIYAQRIDWLLSCDDGEDSFHERLKEELQELNK